MCDICELDYSPPVLRYRHRILYASTNNGLVKVLRDGLKQLDCYVDYCPGGLAARTMIASNLHYALLLLGNSPDVTGPELAQFARSLAHRARTPIIIVPPREKLGDGKHLVARIKRLLAAGARA